MDETTQAVTVEPVSKHAWHTGIGRGWPLSREEEHQFRAQLPSTPHAPELTRSDITTLLVALREGATVTQLRAFLPGYSLTAAAAAYDQLNTALTNAITAWKTLFADPHPSVAVTLCDSLTVLLPVPAARVSSSLTPHAEHPLDTVLDSIKLRLAIAARDTDDIETRLRHASTYSPTAALTYAANLFNPYEHTLWSDPYFLPTRVGQLSTVRTAALLGEPVDAHHGN